MTRQQITVRWRQDVCFASNKYQWTDAVNCASYTIEGRRLRCQRYRAEQAHQLEAAHVWKIISDNDCSIGSLVEHFYAFKCILQKKNDEPKQINLQYSVGIDSSVFYGIGLLFS